MTPFLKEKKNLLALSALIFFQLLLLSFQVPLGSEKNIFEKAVFSVFSPVQHGIISFFQSIGGIWKNYFYFRNVQSQNQKMQKEIFFLYQENNFLRNALQEFKANKEIEEGLAEIYKNILPARVIGLDASNFYKSIIINRGSLNGLKKDMVVLDENGNLVGRVVGPISLKEARVQLITDNDSGVGVFSQMKGVTGVLAGEGNGMCILKYILTTNQDLSEGEEVIVSGKDGIFPSGIKVGRIVSITTDASLFKMIRVEPYFDALRLDRVAIIMKEPDEIF
jgi:rod shape-determining protein MreC